MYNEEECCDGWGYTAYKVKDMICINQEIL